MTDRPTSASDARRAAVTLLDKVLGEGLLLAECQAQVLERLEPADRARAAVALEVLRSLERADRVLAKHLRKPPRFMSETHCVWEQSNCVLVGPRMGW